MRLDRWAAIADWDDREKEEEEEEEKEEVNWDDGRLLSLNRLQKLLSWRRL